MAAAPPAPAFCFVPQHGSGTGMQATAAHGGFVPPPRRGVADPAAAAAAAPDALLSMFGQPFSVSVCAVVVCVKGAGGVWCKEGGLSLRGLLLLLSVVCGSICFVARGSLNVPFCVVPCCRLLCCLVFQGPAVQPPVPLQVPSARNVLKRDHDNHEPSESPSESCKKLLRRISIGDDPTASGASAGAGAGARAGAGAGAGARAGAGVGAFRAPAPAAAPGAGAGALLPLPAARPAPPAARFATPDDFNVDEDNEEEIAAFGRRHLARAARSGAYNRHFFFQDSQSMRSRPPPAKQAVPLPLAPPADNRLAIIPYPPPARVPKPMAAAGASGRGSPAESDDGVVVHSSSPKIELLDSPEKEAKARGLPTVRLPPVHSFVRPADNDADDDDDDDFDNMDDEL